MEKSEMKMFISKLDYSSLIEFEGLYINKKYVLLSEHWTIDEVKERLSYYLDCYMADYLEKIGQSDYYPDDFEHKFDIDDELFLKFLGVPSINYLLKSLLEFEIDDGRTSINEVVNFAWEDYCKYYHDIMIRNDKLTLILEQDKI